MGRVSSQGEEPISAYFFPQTRLSRAARHGVPSADRLQGHAIPYLPGLRHDIGPSAIRVPPGIYEPSIFNRNYTDFGTDQRLTTRLN